MMTEEERVVLHEYIRTEARKLVALAVRKAFDRAAEIAEPVNMTLAIAYRQLANEAQAKREET